MHLKWMSAPQVVILPSRPELGCFVGSKLFAGIGRRFEVQRICDAQCHRRNHTWAASLRFKTDNLQALVIVGGSINIIARSAAFITMALS